METILSLKKSISHEIDHLSNKKKPGKILIDKNPEKTHKNDDNKKK